MKRKSLLVLLVLLSVFIFTGCEKKEEKKPAEDTKTKTKLVENTDYYVRGELTWGDHWDKTKKGYYIDSKNEPNAPYYYALCMGEKPTGGYSLKVKEVNKVNGKTELIVEEIVPGKDETTTQALTYPTLVVEFPTEQEGITIKDTNGGEFRCLNC